MLDELVARVSSADELLALTPSQLDGVLLTSIADRVNSIDPIAAKNVYEEEITGLYPVGVKATYQKSVAADSALMEAWQRLLSHGLIVQAPGQAPRVSTLTAKGREAAQAVNFEEIVVRQMLRREMLHVELRGGLRQFCQRKL
jgi:hypothetical protein